MKPLMQKRQELNGFLSEYWLIHPLAPISEACIAFMRSKKVIPEDPEAIAERTAIQEEGA